MWRDSLEPGLGFVKRDSPEPVERMFDSPKPGQNLFGKKSLVRMFLVGQKREKTALYTKKQ